MNKVLWTLQVFLAAWTIIGAQYMARHYEDLVNPAMLNSLPYVTWGIMATLEVLFALGLVLPGIFKELPKVTSLAAIGIAILFLSGPVFFIGYLSLVGALWGIIPALIALFIAYKRWPKTIE